MIVYYPSHRPEISILFGLMGFNHWATARISALPQLFMNQTIELNVGVVCNVSNARQGKYKDVTTICNRLSEQAWTMQYNAEKIEPHSIGTGLSAPLVHTD